MTRRFGLHHVTMLSTDPVETLRFYREVVRLHLVKRTVNFDAPDIHHLYFGDAGGRPGTLLTFFPFTDAARGHVGGGAAAAISLAIPAEDMETWILHLVEQGVDTLGPTERFGESVLRFEDPFGLALDLIGREGIGAATHPVLAGATLLSQAPAATEALLVRLMGFELAGEERGLRRFVVPGTGESLDLAREGAASPVETGAGIVHHLAFRVPDEAGLGEIRAELVAWGLDPTPVLDRRYFRSVYVREPGGILFEFATDPPGFAVDEPPERLGTSLQLPPEFEPRRADIERRLAPLTPAG
ncbi:VOC family protein [Rhabdaerophilum sp. SD176]|uniref:VOC family protein n=1 Tax=Rhabdaerophilum sp. SD176 TaxID=2983548 RepID=UPI0024DF8834|nr:VOC family protein [Rhabdaerophilum sp. SD176]